MNESTSAQGKSTVGNKNSTIMWIALAVWLGISLLVQAPLMKEYPRLDAGAVFVSGAGPILIISALLLMIKGILEWGVFARLAVGILCVVLGLGELTDLAKASIWGPVGIAELVVVIGVVLWKVFSRRQMTTAN